MILQDFSYMSQLHIVYMHNKMLSYCQPFFHSILCKNIRGNRLYANFLTRNSGFRSIEWINAVPFCYFLLKNLFFLLKHTLWFMKLWWIYFWTVTKFHVVHLKVKNLKRFFSRILMRESCQIASLITWSEIREFPIL